MQTRKPVIENHGIFAEHDQCCAVRFNESAVLNLERGVFEPSWRAQQEGWRLIRADTKLRRFLLRFFE